jgi:hypothetical protein
LWDVPIEGSSLAFKMASLVFMMYFPPMALGKIQRNVKLIEAKVKNQVFWFSSSIVIDLP